MATESQKRWRGIVRKRIIRKNRELRSSPTFDKSVSSCIHTLINGPSHSDLSQIRNCIQENKSSEWMLHLLEEKVLEFFLKILQREKQTKLDVFAKDSLIHLEAIACIKSIINSKEGITSMIGNEETIRKLVQALDTSNVLVKKQIFELLSALSIYSEDGYKLALDALEHYKISKTFRYRFSVIMSELRHAENLSYKTTILAFINCILVATKSLNERVRLRNEFIALNLLDMINELREHEDEELEVQCEVFCEEKLDDEHNLVTEESVDINDSAALFYKINDEIRGKPGEVALLSILQSLYQLIQQDNNEDNEKIWRILEETIQKLVINSSFPSRKLKDSAVQVEQTSANTCCTCGKQTQIHNRTENGLSSSEVISKDEWISDSSEIASSHLPQNDMTKYNESGTTEIVERVNTVCQSDEATARNTAIPPPVVRSGWEDQSSSQMAHENGSSQVHPTTHPPGAPASTSQSLPSLNGSLPLPISSASSVSTSPLSPSSSAAPPPSQTSSVTGGPPPPPPLPPPLPCGQQPLISGGPPPPPPPPFPGCPPPPPPPPFTGGPPPPPPPPFPGGPPPPPPPPFTGGPPPPPPFPGAPPPPPGGPPFLGSAINGALRQPTIQTITTPKPKIKMKVINWAKINPRQIANQGVTLWKEVYDTPDPVEVNYDSIEKLFCQKQIINTHHRSTMEQKVPTEVTLLDAKRSMNINIFLKQLKWTHDDIIKTIEEGNVQKIGAERLRQLSKIMPEKHEVELIEGYSENKSKLGNAEKFFDKVIQLPAYQLRLDAMMLKIDFEQGIDYIKPDIEAVLTAARALLGNKSLISFFRFVLHAGNFINAGSYAGNCVGFKVTSVSKLYEHRANKPRLTLLHFLVEEAETHHKQTILDFAEDLHETLTKAAKISLEQIQSDFKTLKSRCEEFSDQMEDGPQDLKSQSEQFIQEAQKQITEIEKLQNEVEKSRIKLCQHFCESETGVKLEDILEIFSNFCQNVLHCKKENRLRKQQEQRAEKRRLDAEAAKKKQIGQDLLDDSETAIVDKLLHDIKLGNKVRKKRLFAAAGDILTQGM